MEKVMVVKNYDSYNGRRYGNPWAARIVEFSGAPKLEFMRGVYNGSDKGGELVITGEIGEIIKIGQKDFRNPRYTDNDFYKITADGLKYIKSPVDARIMWNEWQQARCEND